MTQRLALVVGVALYIAAFNLSYRELVAPNPIYSSMGLAYSPIGGSARPFIWALCILPALWLPVRMQRPSLLLFFTQYLFIYIPASFILYYSDRPKLNEATAVQLQLLMLAGLSIMQSVYYLPLARVKYRPLRPNSFWVLIAVLIGLPLIYLSITLGHTFRLTSFDGDNPLFRIGQSTILSTGAMAAIGTYGELWLVNILLPSVAALGFFCRRPLYLAMVLVGYVLVYGLTGYRSQLLAPCFICAVYLWTRTKNKYAWLFVALCAALVIPLLVFDELPEKIRIWWVAMWHMRTVSIQGLMFVQYYEFFRHNPITYFTHLNVFNLLGTSPYHNLPFTVSQYFYAEPFGENANFWAADGFSSLGLVGLPVMSVMCAAYFWVLDSLADRYQYRFVLVCMSFLPVCFGNVSLFTNLLSGGLGLLLLLLWLAPVTGPMSAILNRPHGGNSDIEKCMTGLDSWLYSYSRSWRYLRRRSALNACDKATWTAANDHS
jgi:hypothetical protein